MIIVLCHRHVPCTFFQVESKHREQNEQRSWIPSVYKITIEQSTNQSKSLSALGIGRRGRGGQVRMVGVEGGRFSAKFPISGCLVSMSQGWFYTCNLIY